MCYCGGGIEIVEVSVKKVLVSIAVLGCLILSSIAADGTITYKPADGAGKGKARWIMMATKERAIWSGR